MRYTPKAYAYITYMSRTSGTPIYQRDIFVKIKNTIN